MDNKATIPGAGEHPFAPYVRILGKGRTGSRSLDFEEARQAFRMVLAGATDPLQLGAFLMLLRVKEETAEELAGFVTACRESLTPPPDTLHADLDWPSYAGKKHQHPWYILTMLLLAGAGYRVFIHGSAGHTPGRLYTEHAMRTLGLPTARDWHEVAKQLDEQRISYLPLAAFCAPLEELINLRPLLGLRSPVNTLTRMMNPLRAPASLQSIFHPAYAALHQDTDRHLGQPRAVVFKGDSGEVEVKPHADTRLYRLSGGATGELTLGRVIPNRVESVPAPSTDPLRALWREEQADEYGLQATLATTTAALLALEEDLDAVAAGRRAAELWQQRDRNRLDS